MLILPISFYSDVMKTCPWQFSKEGIGLYNEGTKVRRRMRLRRFLKVKHVILEIFVVATRGFYLCDNF